LRKLRRRRGRERDPQGEGAMVGAVIVGAGEGRRMSGRGRKQFAKISGKPLFTYTLEVFEASPSVDHIVMVVPRDSVDWAKEEIVEAYGFKKIHATVYGGETRQQSVYSGLKALRDGTRWVVIHDAVRPLVSETLIKRVLDASKKVGAAITGVPARDTVKKVESGQIVGTLDRRLLWLAQTPQAFRYDIIMEAHRRALSDKVDETDDASLVEKYVAGVVVAVGSYSNLKVTSPEDLPLLEYFLRHDNRARLELSRRESSPRPSGPPRPTRSPRESGSQRPSGSPRGSRPPRGRRQRSRRR
jgi:2-C-methyl-D-erythritol 4-phosphate cytidylyltransferase